jgi:hypothetical protein
VSFSTCCGSGAPRVHRIVEFLSADRYAEIFHQAGFAVLLYDHANLRSQDAMRNP